MAIIATGSKTIIDLSDGKSLSVYLGANQPRTQIHDVNGNTYNPNWTTTAGKLVPAAERGIGGKADQGDPPQRTSGRPFFARADIFRDFVQGPAQHLLIGQHPLDRTLRLAKFGRSDHLHGRSDLERALDGLDVSLDFLERSHNPDSYMPAMTEAAVCSMTEQMPSSSLPAASASSTSACEARMRSRKRVWNSRTRSSGMSFISACVPQ